MRISLALPGLHRVHRGAEVALTEVGRQLAREGHEVTLFGSGHEQAGEPYRFVHVPAVPREAFERWPKLPALRGETAWEEATFLLGLLSKYRPGDFDIAATCAYPFTNWALRRPILSGSRPKTVFITQNGDWPAFSNSAEFRFFKCDGLVCTNPDYFERNRNRYHCALIPNGVDLERFSPGLAERARFGLPQGPLVLMVSALIPSKNVAEGIAAVAEIPSTTLVVAGDGPLREEMRSLADKLLPGRYYQLVVPAADMPALYRSADAFMHLSIDESFGNIFIEAMATGLPIVAFDTPRTRWIIGDEAFFPQTNEPQGLPLAVCAALARGRRGTAPQRVNNFAWPTVAALYEQFFYKLLQ